MKNDNVSRFFSACLAICLMIFSLAAPSAAHGDAIPLASFEKRPKLVLVLVIDQFRADNLTRFSGRFLPAKQKNGAVGGFKYLMANGAYFPAARYDVLQTITCPGHAMIMSGTYPSKSGIILNDWYDQKAGRLVYCADDEESPIVGASGSGLSPKNFIGSTVGDELKNAGFPSRVVGIATKDRGAIMLGGHRADLALWLSDSFQWVSSRHYLKTNELPAWISKLNKDLEARKGKDYDWLPTQGKSTGFSQASATDVYKKTRIGSPESLSTPLGVELTADLTLAAARELKMGSQSSTDILAVSFSAHDYLGHKLGPHAHEMEEMTVAEDRAIARVLNGIKSIVPGGLKDVVIVLTADHGVAPQPEFAKANGLPAGRIETKQVVARAEKALVDAFGKSDSEWIAAVKSLNFYLNSKALSERKITSVQAETVLKRALLEDPGVAHVFTKSEYIAGLLPAGFERQIRNSFVLSKSGDVVVIPKPFFIDDNVMANHLSGYSYDRTVPLIIAGPKLKAGVYSTEADIVDIAPTLSFLMGVLPPAQSDGRILTEAIGK